MSKNYWVFLALATLFLLAFWLPRRETPFDGGLPLVGPVADFAARATGGAQGAFDRGDYRSALEKIEEETSTWAFQDAYGFLPSKLEDAVFVKAVSEARRDFSSAQDAAARASALVRHASAEFDFAERLSYSDEPGAEALSIRSYLRSIVLAQESAELKENSPAYRQIWLALFEMRAEAPAIIAAFDTASRLNPKDPVPFFRKGLVLSWEGKADEAVAAYSDALQADPAFERAYVNLGYEYSAMGRKWSAYEAYGKALEICKEYCHVAYHNRASASFGAKDYDAAVKDEEAALAAAESKGYSYRNAYGGLGRAYLAKRDYANAVTYLRLSLNDPYYAPTHDNDWNYNTHEELEFLSLARAYFLLKDYPNARTYAEMADKTDPSDDTREMLRFIKAEEKKTPRKTGE